MSSWYSPLFFLLASSNEDQLRKQIEFLKAENEILRKHVPKQRIFLDNEDRERLLKLGDAIGKGVLQLVSIVSPRTYQRWQSRVSQGQKPTKKMGRKGTPESIREIVIRLQRIVDCCGRDRCRLLTASPKGDPSMAAFSMDLREPTTSRL